MVICGAGDGEDERSMAPFATTPDIRILEMIRMAKVTTEDVVADLGAGIACPQTHQQAERAVVVV